MPIIKNKLKNWLDITPTMRISFTKSLKPEIIDKIMSNRHGEGIVEFETFT